MAQANKTRRIGRNRNQSAIALDIQDINDNLDSNAVTLSKKWHGRNPKEVIKVVEREEYDTDLAKLADLVELVILHPKVNRIVPVSFRDSGVALAGKGNNLYLVGGNQEIDCERLQGELGLSDAEIPRDRQYLNFGEVYSVVYFADKHHLTGPATQKKGTEYEHLFGEQDEKNSERPEFVYDSRNKKVMLVGGSYEIREEGIWN